MTPIVSEFDALKLILIVTISFKVRYYFEQFLTQCKKFSYSFGTLIDENSYSTI